MKLKFVINKKIDLQYCRNKQEKVLLNQRYKTAKKYLEKTAFAYQKSWDQINDRFFKYIKNTTGFDWQYNKYICVVSVIHPGIANWGNNNIIVRWWEENPYLQRKITAHELIISHYFTIIRKNYKQYKLKDKQIWALAEIAAFALTSLTKESKLFWPWDSQGYYYNHNYQSIVLLQKRMKNIFLKRKDFDEYILKGIKLAKKYKNIKFD